MSNITSQISTNNQPLIQNLDCYQTYFEIDRPRDGLGKTLVKIVLWILCFWFLIPWKALRAGATEQNQILPTSTVTTSQASVVVTPAPTNSAPPATTSSAQQNPITPTAPSTTQTATVATSAPTSTVATSTSAIACSTTSTPASLDSTLQTIRIRSTAATLSRHVLSANGYIRYCILVNGACCGEICFAFRNNHIEIRSYRHQINSAYTTAEIEEAKELLIRLAVEESNSHGFEGRVKTAEDSPLAEILRRRSARQTQQTAPTPPAPPTTAATTTQASVVVTTAPTHSTPAVTPLAPSTQHN